MQPQTAAIVASAADFMWSRPLATSVEGRGTPQVGQRWYIDQ